MEQELTSTDVYLDDGLFAPDMLLFELDDDSFTDVVKQNAHNALQSLHQPANSEESRCGGVETTIDKPEPCVRPCAETEIANEFWEDGSSQHEDVGNLVRPDSPESPLSKLSAKQTLLRALGLPGCDYRQDPFNRMGFTKRHTPNRKMLLAECNRRMAGMGLTAYRGKWRVPNSKWPVASLTDWLVANPTRCESEARELRASVDVLKTNLRLKLNDEKGGPRSKRLKTSHNNQERGNA